MKNDSLFSLNYKILFMKKTKLFLMTLLVAAGFTSCSDDDSNKPEGTATVAVKLTDAPGDYKAVFVDVQDVMVKVDAETEAETSTDVEADEEGWVSLGNVQPQRINLLDLTGGITQLLGEAEIPAGYMHEMRLVLGENNGIVFTDQENDEETPLDTPSAQQSGLKVKVDQELEANTYYTFIIDFDVDKSIVTQGNGGHSLKPVLRVAVEEDAGSIAGTVTQTSEMVLVEAQNGDVVTSAYVNAEGRFQLHGLAPGIYTVTFTPAEGSGLDAQTIENVEVKVGEVTEIEPVTLEVTVETSVGV